MSSREVFQKLGRYVKREMLLILIIIGCVLGFILGYLLQEPIHDSEDKSKWLNLLGFPGELFMRMLKMIILPLIVASLISALANLNASGKLGLRAIVYYMSTTFLAVVLGIILVTSIQPGGSSSKSDDKKNAAYTTILDSFLDLIRNLFPNNIVEAAFRSTRTKYNIIENSVPKNVSTFVNVTDNNTTTLQEHFKIEHDVITSYVREGLELKNGMNILGLVMFSCVFGKIINSMGHQGKPLVSFFVALDIAVMKMVTLVMWFSPIGIMCLIAAKLAAMSDIGLVLSRLGMYMLTVILGLLLHGFLVMPLVYFAVTRKNPLTFIKGMVPAIATAFGTASSSATLPTTISCLEDRLGIDNRVTRFMLPLGATINMDGTALYEAVAAIFIAQSNNINLSAAEVITTCITATLASIGAAGVPQAGLVTMVIVLQAVNLPAEDVGIILAVDWFLDRIRTAINVWGDACGVGIVAHLSRKELQEPSLYQTDDDGLAVTQYPNGIHHSTLGLIEEKEPSGMTTQF